MARRKDHEDEDDRPRRPDRSLATRAAWGVLVMGAGLLAVRASIATVVKIHGDGMAPTIVDGDHVVLLRSELTLEGGDLVVYDPRPHEPVVPEAEHLPMDDPAATRSGREQIREGRPPRGSFPNAAVVDVKELERGWERVKIRSGVSVQRPQTTSFRVGRVLAQPGARVTFHSSSQGLGIAVEGELVQQKISAPLRVRLSEEPDQPRMRASAYESLGDRRYRVLPHTGAGTVSWEGLGLPPASAGPVEVEAPGYLIIADNRNEGACCDSRAIGWVHPEQIRGELVMRLPGDPGATPDLAPEARGFRLFP